MARRQQHVEPRNYFLNELHELASVEKSGGGKWVDFAGISWAAKSKKLSQSLTKTSDRISSSKDPLKDEMYFVLAEPVAKIQKRSTDKKKARNGVVEEQPEFGGVHGKVFERLGLDLIQVTEDGKAVVHGVKDRMEQLLERASSLEDLGAREQARWVAVESFDEVPPQLRVDADWFKTLRKEVAADVVFELQPILTRRQADVVLRTIADVLMDRPGEKLSGTGSDFSGRVWFKGKATPRSIQAVAKDFYSVQAIHSPLYSIAASRGLGKRVPIRVPAQPATPLNVADLPCVAVVDLGVPSNHKQLGSYRRGGFIPQDAARAPVGDHGSFVASRVVFGHLDRPEQYLSAQGECSFFDAMVGDYPTTVGQADRINDKVVMEALRGVRGSAPDVRVFNLSIGDARPLNALSAVERAEKRRLMQDIDNFAVDSDAIIVVAAGNSIPGQQPNAKYPDHHADPAWALGAWACGYNTLICGSHVDRISSNGLVQHVGWPSPFTRVGPGICEAPVPSFCAPGGNCDDAWGYRSGMGVPGLSGTGIVEDRCGTSYAAPLLAREAAFALRGLQQYCPSGIQPFAVTVRALLTICAVPTTQDERVKALADVSLGEGRSSSVRLGAPKPGAALILWQGYIESPNDKARIQLPVPLDWLKHAEAPFLRLVVAWDPPVNESAQTTWTCRRVKPVVHLGPDAPFVAAPRGGHSSFPVIDRRYKLRKYAAGDKAAEGDMWLVELAYEELFPPPPGMVFDPRQRVAFAAELVDEGEDPVDPHPAMQALPIASSLIRLSAIAQAVQSPIIVRTRR
jgi:hypothetical protein